MKTILGTVKGKVITGFVAVGLLSGVGTAFANTDAGAQLGSWYQAKFNLAKGESATAFAIYGASVGNKAISDAKELKNTTVNTIKTAGENESTRASAAINNAKQSHIDAINNKEASITTNMPGEFDRFVNGVNKQTDGLVSTATFLAKKDFTKEVNKQGADSVASVNTNVGKTKTDAVAALQQEIEATKAELSRLIEAEKAAATQEMKTNLDEKIKQAMAEITQLLADLETANKKAITDKGAEIELAAKSELDALVSGIIK
ncbi:hypothetical protein [Peribacillus alkalitolerans]|uniref:hypothetical protein n=1 Tax=Peribacillus alkalitolerans TaxID=1550385 RepID=UPI0013D0C6C7|nr:hypothetical protein [Peribacillus alkalitolerans]